MALTSKGGRGRRPDSVRLRPQRQPDPTDLQRRLLDLRLDADNRLIQVRRTTTDGARFDEDRYDESNYLSGGDPVEELVVDYTYDSQGRLQTRSDGTSTTRWTWSGWDCELSPLEMPSRKEENVSQMRLNESEKNLGWTALTEAVMQEDFNEIQRLLAQGGDPNLPNEDGSTSLTWVRSSRAVQMLAKGGAQVSVENPEGGLTSVHNAVERRDFNALCLLISKCGGSSAFDSVDEIGRTPLAIAAQNGNIECLKILLSAGADPYSCTDEPFSRDAFEYARENDQEEALAILTSFTKKH